MKICITIWAIFILALGFVPCFDEIEDCNITQTHTEKNHAKDGCSPFCFCMCHGAVIIYETATFITNINVQPIATEICSNQDLYSQIYLNAIWQPPTL